MGQKTSSLRVSGVAAGCVVTATLVGCTGQVSPSALVQGFTGPQKVVGIGFVQQSPTHEPTLCYPVRTGFEERCWGIPITNWEWEKVGGKYDGTHATESRNYVLIGTWADGKLTLTEDPILEKEYTGPRPEETWGNKPPHDPPCKAAPGAWAQKHFPDWSPTSFWDKYPELGNPGMNPNAPKEVESERVKTLPHVVSAWTRPLDPQTGKVVDEEPKRDSYEVLSVGVAGSTHKARRQLSKIYSGPLCVVNSRVRRDRLNEIPDEIHNFLTANPEFQKYAMPVANVNHAHIELDVMYDDGGLQKTMDKKYGKGLVFVRSTALHPIPAK